MIDRRLLHSVMQKLGETPVWTAEDARGTLPKDQQQASLAELDALAKEQQKTKRLQYGSKPWVQNTAVGVGGAGLGAGIGGLLGGKQAVLPGAIMGGFIALIAKFFFKDQFDEAFKWINQTMQRPDAENVLAKVKQQLSRANPEAAKFVQDLDTTIPVMQKQLGAYKQELKTHADVVNKTIQETQKQLTDTGKQLSKPDPAMPPEQRQALQLQQSQLQTKLNAFNAQSAQLG